MTGEVEISFFGKTYDQYSRDLASDTVLVIKTRAREKGDGGLQFSAVEVKTPHVVPEDTTPILVTLPAARVTPGIVEQVKDILRAYPGTVEVRMVLTGREKPLVMRLDDEYRVVRSSSLFGDLKAALGPSCLSTESPDPDRKAATG
jgi:DNA polymerase III subunit alpha